MTQIKEEPFEIDQESQYLNGEDQNLDIESQYYTDSALLENVHYTTSQESNIKSEFPEDIEAIKKRWKVGWRDAAPQRLVDSNTYGRFYKSYEIFVLPDNIR